MAGWLLSNLWNGSNAVNKKEIGQLSKGQIRLFISQWFGASKLHSCDLHINMYNLIVLCCYLEEEGIMQPNPGRQPPWTTRNQLPDPAAHTLVREALGESWVESCPPLLPPVWFGRLKSQRLLFAFTVHLPLHHGHCPSIPAALRLGVWGPSQFCVPFLGF